MTPSAPLPWWTKPWIVLRLWGWVAIVHVGLWRVSLPRMVDVVCRPPSRPPRRRLTPRHWSNLNDRVLRIGGARPRCLLRALVHQRCLRAQGEPADLVIGLPAQPADRDAHAWVELDGRVVGPSPGRLGHIELVRYPAAPAHGAQPSNVTVRGMR